MFEFLVLSCFVFIVLLIFELWWLVISRRFCVNCRDLFFVCAKLVIKWFSLDALCCQPSVNPSSRSFAVYGLTIRQIEVTLTLITLISFFLLNKQKQVALISIRLLLSDFLIIYDYFSRHTDRHYVEYFYVCISCFYLIFHHYPTHRPLCSCLWCRVRSDKQVLQTLNVIIKNT